MIQVAVGDGDRSGGIAVEERLVHLPAQAAESINGATGIAQPQSGQVRPGEVADTAACSPDGHDHGDELRVGSGQF